jgi:hypothetical protein
VYVDDLIIYGPNAGEINKFKQQMMKSFKMSDLGLLSYYLGIEVKQKNGEITISQSAYTGRILEMARMTGCNPCTIPMDPRLQLTKETAGAPIDPARYRSIICSLRYLVNTWPDIAFAVGMVSRFMEAPRDEHWQAVKQILRYLAGTAGHGCVYGAGARRLQSLVGFSDSDHAGDRNDRKSTTRRLQSLVGFSDSDHAGDRNDRKSTTGIVFFLGGNLITWVSQKQKVVAL